jgi:hypothetical protein
MPNKIVEIEEVGAGVLAARFKRALAEVAANMLDPNTGDGARKVTLTATLKPNQAKTEATVKYAVSTSLQPPEPHEGTVFFGKNADGITVIEANPDQEVMNFPDGETISARNMRVIGGR